MDELLEKSSQEFDFEKRRELLYQAQVIALEDVPWRPAYAGLSQLALQPWMKGMRFGPGTNYDMFAKEWWLDK